MSDSFSGDGHWEWKSDYRQVGYLLKVRGRGSAGFGAAGGLARVGRTILELDGEAAGFGLEGTGATWLQIADNDPWAELHAMQRRGGMGFGTRDVLAAEPDMEWQWPSPAGDGPPVTDFNAWHLDPAFSNLGTARNAVAAHLQQEILIAHLDTGFDPAFGSYGGHQQTPEKIEAGHRSFVSGDKPEDGARDKSGSLIGLHNRGHGTATLAILAGPGYGGVPHARLLPLRVGNDVVIVSTGTIVAGFNEAVRRGCDLLSMSMGGLASGAIADAVNLAYDRGMVMVTAAGNTMHDKPFPSIVWPARFRRVVAACGKMRDGSPYEWPNSKPMAGCNGPMSKMRTAITAFTPDIPWAEIGTGDRFTRGGGTSSATPQVAAAVALRLAKWKGKLDADGYLPWQRGEAPGRLCSEARAGATPTTMAIVLTANLVGARSMQSSCWQPNPGRVTSSFARRRPMRAGAC